MIMPDDKLKRLLDVLYNRFFQKWKSRKMKEADWQLLMADIDALAEQGDDYELARDLILAFASELERRLKNENQN